VDRERGEALVLELLGAHADSLLRVARRYSMCADDAHDAYQRGLEILMRHAARLDPERAPGWLHTVVKHEALAINRSRRRIVGFAEVDLDALESRTSASPEERVLGADRVRGRPRRCTASSRRRSAPCGSGRSGTPTSRSAR
jgi:DNA-directed RNA polymerase specialized sigma24 family protein